MRLYNIPPYTCPWVEASGERFPTTVLYRRDAAVGKLSEEKTYLTLNLELIHNTKFLFQSCRIFVPEHISYSNMPHFVGGLRFFIGVSAKNTT